jgi:hypothetical protein
VYSKGFGLAFLPRSGLLELVEIMIVASDRNYKFVGGDEMDIIYDEVLHSNIYPAQLPKP